MERTKWGPAMNRIIALVFLVLAITGCTHSLHISHVGDFSPTYKEAKAGKLIKSHAEQFTILGFVTQTDYVDSAYASLVRQCQSGNVQGVVTQYQTSHGFFSWTHSIDMQGLCVQ